jgi:biopolymer transport protein ExbD
MNIGSEGTSSNGGGRGGSQDFELNLASIIDCLTVLITFLLASTAFISIGILDAGVAAGGTQAQDGTPPPVNITLELGAGHSMTVKTSGKASSSNTIPAVNGAEWNMNALTQRLQALHQQWPTVNAVTLSADGNVEYKDVVQVMDTTRKTIPVVLLGGF